jgi:sugar lactone lactonase YvrE
MSLGRALGFLSLACAIGVCAAAESLLIATTPSAISQSGTGGTLYAVEMPAGTSKLVAPILLDGREPLRVPGLAVHRSNGTLYGITADDSPSHPRSLVTIDPATARATLVGPLGMAGIDIAFDQEGTLFVWLRETSQIGTVDLATGRARAMGKPGPPSEPGGLTIDAKGRIYVIGSGGSASIDVVDPATGAITQGASLKDAPYAAGMNSIRMSPDGTLYAVNSNRGAPAKTALVRIDPQSGTVTRVTALPDDADALAVVRGRDRDAESFFASAAGLATIVALVLLALALVYFVRTRKSKRR